jgi:hypothetical protein
MVWAVVQAPPSKIEDEDECEYEYSIFDGGGAKESAAEAKRGRQHEPPPPLLRAPSLHRHLEKRNSLDNARLHRIDLQIQDPFCCAQKGIRTIC